MYGTARNVRRGQWAHTCTVDVFVDFIFIFLLLHYIHVLYYQFPVFFSSFIQNKWRYKNENNANSRPTQNRWSEITKWRRKKTFNRCAMDFEYGKYHQYTDTKKRKTVKAMREYSNSLLNGFLLIPLTSFRIEWQNIARENGIFVVQLILWDVKVMHEFVFCVNIFPTINVRIKMCYHTDVSNKNYYGPIEPMNKKLNATNFCSSSKSSFNPFHMKCNQQQQKSIK